MSDESPDNGKEPRRKILIVDDSPMFQELEGLFLARSGRVLLAGDALEALAIARRERPDVVVADLSMPEIGGDDLCRRIKADPDLRKTPVVVVTGRTDGDEHERCVRAGADDVVEKPVSRVSLIQAVNRFLRLAVRGLVRVPLETEVHMGSEEHDAWGWARNVSRGGMFVEAETTLEPDTEVSLEFTLPETRHPLEPTAKVVWRRAQTATLRPGMGLQFLKLDRLSAQRIDEYVYMHADPAELDDGVVVMVR